MANEILVLERQTLGISGADEQFTFIFFFPLEPVIQVNGFTVIPSPSTGLPSLVLDAGILSPGELQALDAGDAAWVASIPFVKSKEQSNSEFLSTIQERYNSRVVDETQRLRDLYSFYGTRLDA